MRPRLVASRLVPPDSTSDQMTARAPKLAETAPTRSRAAPLAGASGRRSPDKAAPANPTGTFTQNTQCQLSPWVTPPPTSGPAATAKAGDGAPYPDHAPTAFGPERRGEDREAERRHDRCPEALHRPGGYEERCAGRQGAGRRGQAEQRQAGDVHPSPPEALADARRGDDPGGKDEQVGVDRPLQGGDLPAQLTVDGGQGGDDHQGVEGHHEEGDRGEEQRPACPGGLLGGYGQGWGHRLPPLLVGTRAARPVQVVIRTGRDIYRHCRQPGGPLDCAGELAHRVRGVLRLPGSSALGGEGPGARTEAQKPMSAPRQLGRTSTKGGSARRCRQCSPRRDRPRRQATARR